MFSPSIYNYTIILNALLNQSTLNINVVPKQILTIISINGITSTNTNNNMVNITNINTITIVSTSFNGGLQITYSFTIKKLGKYIFCILFIYFLLLFIFFNFLN